MKIPPAWVENNNIPFRKSEERHQDIKFPYEIGFWLDIHIQQLEFISISSLGYNRWIWNPLPHAVAKVLVWGEWRTRVVNRYDVFFYADRGGPQLPHMSHSQACVQLHQEGEMDTLKHYRNLCAALSRLHSTITLGNIYTRFDSWPDEVRNAIPQPIRGILVSRENPNSGINALKPDRVEVINREETWFRE